MTVDCKTVCQSHVGDELCKAVCACVRVFYVCVQHSPVTYKSCDVPSTDTTPPNTRERVPLLVFFGVSIKIQNSAPDI